MLALSALLCGGAFAESAATVTVLRQVRPASLGQASDLPRGGSAGSTATLLSYLADAAKELQKVHDRAHPAAIAAAGLDRIDPPSLLPKSRLWHARLLPDRQTVSLHHLNLPPPRATL